MMIDPSQPFAVAAYAITTATKICLPFTALKNELLLVLHQLAIYPQKTAITSRIKRALQALN